MVNCRLSQYIPNVDSLTPSNLPFKSIFKCIFKYILGAYLTAIVYIFCTFSDMALGISLTVFAISCSTLLRKEKSLQHSSQYLLIFICIYMIFISTSLKKEKFKNAFEQFFASTSPASVGACISLAESCISICHFNVCFLFESHMIFYFVY